jgi:hypothetical protein
MAPKICISSGQGAELHGMLPMADLRIIAGQDQCLDLVDVWPYRRATHCHREQKIAE